MLNVDMENLLKIDSCIPSLPTVIYADEVKADPNWSAPLHSHNDVLEIIFIYEGCGIFQYDGRVYKIKKGDILLLNPGVPHYEYSDFGNPRSSISLRISNLNIDGMQDNFIISETLLPIYSTGVLFDVFSSMIHSIYFEYKRCQDGVFSAPGQQLLLCLLNLLPYCKRTYDDNIKRSSDKENRMLLNKQIKDYLDKNYMYNIHLHDIADNLHFSQYYISHIFKYYNNVTINQYITRRRIGEAQCLLTDTDWSIDEIGKKVGYENVTHFYSMFKKIKGIPPNAFRKTKREDMSI